MAGKQKEKDYVAKETRNTRENEKISGNIKASRLQLTFDHIKKIGSFKRFIIACFIFNFCHRKNYLTNLKL